jgi:hypothetical protein
VLLHEEVMQISFFKEEFKLADARHENKEHECKP